MAMTKAVLQEKYDALIAEHTALKAKQDSLYRDILHKAGEAAYEHTLCDVLEQTLTDIGIPIGEVEIVVKSEALYTMSILDAYRHGFLDESEDLKERFANHVLWEEPEPAETQTISVVIREL